MLDEDFTSTTGLTLSIEITHIRLAGASRAHEYITGFRWTNRTTGATNDSSKTQLVAWIDAKQGSAYVGNGPQQAPVGTVHPAGGAPYLRTHADGEWTNNLLSLPEF
jgi:hypothetical protein